MPRNRPATLEPLTPAFFVVAAVHVALGFGIWWAWQEMHTRRGTAALVWMRPADFSNPVPASSSPAVPKAIPIASSKKSTVPKAIPISPKPPEEPVAKATLIVAPQQQPAPAMSAEAAGTPLFAGAPVPKSAANRSITLRRVPTAPPPAPPTETTPAPPAKSASLADMARLATLRPAPPPTPAPPPVDPAAGINMDAVDNAVNTAFYTQWAAPALDAVPDAQRSAQLTISIRRDGTILSSQMSRPSGSHPLDDSILAAAAKVKKIDATLPSQFAKDSYDLELTFLLLP
ncbi:MAG: TonB C-terminal domain-containing protein [Verrucomicrobiaceae bacterium]|nr:TonB C-terminal domain-containing protein [Verrucomicrobiaceae bacterium]